MLAIIGASGKLAYATLDALLTNNLIPASQILCTSSSATSSPNYRKLLSRGVTVKLATFDLSSSIKTALAGCDRLFLVSSPRIAMDFNDAPHGSGREKDHITAIDAAIEAGVKHIYYTSLAFGNPSEAGVMRAHIRTEAYLAGLKNITYTIIREGLYNESWPLYLGHYDLKGDERAVVPVAGDCPISWTSIADLGFANALVLAAPTGEYAGKTFYLSNTKDPKSLVQVAKLVAHAKGRDIRLEILARQDHERYYVEERAMDEGMIKWWATSYDALRDQECLIKDTTFDELLESKGRTPKPIEETIKEMIEAA